MQSCAARGEAAPRLDTARPDSRGLPVAFLGAHGAHPSTVAPSLEALAEAQRFHTDFVSVALNRVVERKRARAAPLAPAEWADQLEASVAVAHRLFDEILLADAPPAPHAPPKSWGDLADDTVSPSPPRHTALRRAPCTRRSHLAGGRRRRWWRS